MYRLFGFLLFFVIFVPGCANQVESKRLHDFDQEEADYPYLFFPYDPAADLYSGNPLQYINVHCTADLGGTTPSYYDNLWKSYNWTYPGYNYLIYEDGTIDTLLPEDGDCLVEIGEVSNGVFGVNSRSINIAYVGGVKRCGRKLDAYDTRTPAQIESMHRLVKDIRSRCPNVRVYGHRDHQNVRKECPSFNAYLEFN